MPFFAALAPYIPALIGAGASIYSANKNSDAAQSAAQAGQFTPYNIFGPSGSAGFMGNNAFLENNPQSQYLNDMYSGGAGGLFGNYLNGQNGGPGNINELAGEYDQSNAGSGGQGMMDLGNQFLGQLGSTDPNQLASSYASNIRSLEAPAESRAANGLATRLFSQGRLGATGGQSMFGELMNQQNQAEIQRQIAGQQYAGNEQSRLGQLGSNLQTMGYGRVQDRFNRAQSLFGAGQQNQNQLLQGFQAGNNANLNNQGMLLNMANLGAQTGTGASMQNFAAQQPVLAAQQSQNAALYGGLGSALGNIDWGGLLSRSPPVSTGYGGAGSTGPNW